MWKFLSLVASVLVVASVVGCDSQPGGVGPGGPDAGGLGDSDADEDTISDEYEGRSDDDDNAPDADTDGDGEPDYLDVDSDDDGILDADEAGDDVLESTPRDADGDGVPDFRDTDSDGNGYPDSSEATNDNDGDGALDYHDLDDDEDGVRDDLELSGTLDPPADSDADGVPNYHDPDSDDDTILDGDEFTVDTDGDGLMDWEDRDSDNDGIPDADEAGDDDLRSAPIDTDGDAIADFRDPDADNDGLSDRDEHVAGSDPVNSDSDGDHVSDLVEVASGTDALDPGDNPRSRGDFVFLEPYMAPADPAMDTLDFATDIRKADVYFLMDTTGSMSSSVNSLRSSLASFITDVRTEIPDVWIGNGFFKDYPVSPYGSTFSPPDVAYGNCQNLTGDVAAATAGLSCYEVSGGADSPESYTAALWATATGMGLAGNSGYPTGSTCAAGLFGGPCFRSAAVPIVVLITDVPTHNGPGGSEAYSDTSIGGHAPTYAETITALNDANVRVIGIGQGSGGEADLQSFARDTNAVSATGAPLYSTTTGTIGATVLDHIRVLATQTQFRVSIEFHDDSTDGVDAFAAFVDHVEARPAGDGERGCVALPAIDTDVDGHVDTFPGVTTGERICFDIFVKQNDTVMPTGSPQLFRATLRVVGDGFTELDSRDVYFLVPPVIEDPDGPD